MVLIKKCWSSVVASLPTLLQHSRQVVEMVVEFDNRCFQNCGLYAAVVITIFNLTLEFLGISLYVDTITLCFLSLTIILKMCRHSKLLLATEASMATAWSVGCVEAFPHVEASRLPLGVSQIKNPLLLERSQLNNYNLDLWRYI